MDSNTRTAMHIAQGFARVEAQAEAAGNAINKLLAVKYRDTFSNEELAALNAALQVLHKTANKYSSFMAVEYATLQNL